jgi:serine protease AprX
VQLNLLRTLLDHGEAALHEQVQKAWPLDAKAAFGALPTPLRLHADARFAGRGVTLALLDAGFYPHPDLIEPRNRIRAWVDATRSPVLARRFPPGRTPRWPDWNAARDWQWHGLMTSVVAAGNGFLSHGLYRGLASEADVVLIQVRDPDGHITNDSIARAFRWLMRRGRELNVRVVSASVGGDPVATLRGNPVDAAAEALVESGISVVVAAGNDGQRRLLPPATAPLVLTIGGIDDRNTFSHDEIALWHSNYGEATNEMPKPELVAPSIWVAAPVLPGTGVAREAQELFARRTGADRSADARMAELKLITPFYQHVEGTSFAAPIVASTIACMLEANPALSPLLVREILMATAHTVSNAAAERQGAGALDAGRAVARALAERHRVIETWPFSPRISPEGVTFALHDHDSKDVRVIGSWDQWTAPGWAATPVEAGMWRTEPRALPPGEYAYKFVLDGWRWVDDPGNPRKIHDGRGGLNSVLVVP